MRVLAFNGSPRIKGNTSQALEVVLKELRSEGIETKLIEMGSEVVEPCQACYACGKNRDERCNIDTDKVNEWIQMIKGADGIIVGSPTYFGNVSAQTKAFIDRVGFVARANGDMFKRKVGAAVVINRRAGGLATFSDINNFFLIGQMIVPGSNYWNLGVGLKPGDIQSDKEGVQTLKVLGQNMAWLIKKLA